MARIRLQTAVVSALILLAAGCSNDDSGASQKKPQHNEQSTAAHSKESQAGPDAIPVLVNKENSLPEDYEPKDLVYPDIDFIFEEKNEKRMMRKEAAESLEKLFAAAHEAGMDLAGVSAYRSHHTQETLFSYYVNKDGEEEAKTYSAVPGTSEHETGLAIDVTSRDGKCAAQDCFGSTEEASWLADHAADYGFIIRYPDGKEDITGYKYEPWHIRYVGEDAAKQIAANDSTLEEYSSNLVVKK